MSQDQHARIHATLVAIPRPGMLAGGVLLLGKPGSGKSDVALRLIDGGAALVSDDQVDLTFGDGGLWGSPPAATAGLIEARGMGLIRLPFEPRVRIAMAVELGATTEIERMPSRRWYQPPEQFRARAGALRIPLFALRAFQASTPAKIRAAILGKLEA
jgi:serine kinase of HPr protein (carbohydrate metabolism regulator)